MPFMLIVQERGARVTMFDFGDSGHVAHCKKYPDQYRELVKEFLGETWGCCIDVTVKDS